MPLLETKLIERIRRQARARAGVIRGIGDDCAVLRLPRGHEALVTTDFSLEGVHFRREWHPPDAVGHRCLARGLSDIAAMGGEPIAAFLSLALPRDLAQPWVDQFIGGLLRLAKKFRTSLAGGDIAQSPAGVLADIVVLGSVPRGAAVLRSGARPGDGIFVTAELGGSSAVLETMLATKRRLNPADYPRHFYPLPRVAVGRFLRTKKLASAIIDLSDGLSTDLNHICEESRVGAMIEADKIPIARLKKPVDKVTLRQALHGGEDYELLFTVPPGRRVPSSIAGVKITHIGEIVRGQGLKLKLDRNRLEQLSPQGWQHFTS